MRVIKFQKISQFLILEVLVLVLFNQLEDEPENKAGYTATSCGQVGRGGNACFPTIKDGWTNGPTDGPTD